MTPVRIADPEDPRLADYRALQAARDRPDAARFIAEGALVVERLLGCRFAVRSVLGTLSHVERLAPALAGRPEVAVFVAEQPVIAAAVGGNFHRGVAACGLRPPELRWDEMSSGTFLKDGREDMSSWTSAEVSWLRS